MHDEAASIFAEAYPCDDCPLAGFCAATGAACKAFSAYVKGEPWGKKPREPDAFIGKRLGLVTDEDLARWRERLTRALS